MYKVLFFNGNSCTGFSMEFQNKINALDACEKFHQLHGNNTAYPFDDRTESQKMNDGSRRMK